MSDKLENTIVYELRLSNRVQGVEEVGFLISHTNGRVEVSLSATHAGLQDRKVEFLQW